MKSKQSFIREQMKSQPEKNLLEKMLDIFCNLDWKQLDLSEIVYYKNKYRDNEFVRSFRFQKDDLSYIVQYEPIRKLWQISLVNGWWVTILAGFRWKKYQSIEDITNNLARVFDPLNQRSLKDLESALSGIMHLHDPDFTDATFLCHTSSVCIYHGKEKRYLMKFIGSDQKNGRSILSNTVTISNEARPIITINHTLPIKRCQTHHERLNAYSKAERLFPKTFKSVENKTFFE